MTYHLDDCRNRLYIYMCVCVCARAHVHCKIKQFFHNVLTN